MLRSWCQNNFNALAIDIPVTVDIGLGCFMLALPGFCRMAQILCFVDEAETIVILMHIG